MHDKGDKRIRDSLDAFYSYRSTCVSKCSPEKNRRELFILASRCASNMLGPGRALIVCHFKAFSVARFRSSQVAPPNAGASPFAHSSERRKT